VPLLAFQPRSLSGPLCVPPFELRTLDVQTFVFEFIQVANRHLVVATDASNTKIPLLIWSLPISAVSGLHMAHLPVPLARMGLADSPVRAGILTRLPCSRRRQICRCPDTPRDSHSIANRTHAGQYAYGHNMAIIRDLEWVVNANTSPTCMWPSTDGNAASGYMRGWAALRLSLTGTGV
jgi:hypothetical protein